MSNSTELDTINEYREFIEQRKICHLPRWNELPELELYMDQVITLMNRYTSCFSPDKDAQLTPAMINNYVKHCIIPSPVKKKYGRVHLSRLLIVCALKSVLPISSIAELTDNLLKNHTEQELHDFFVEHYEQAFADTMEALKNYTENVVNSNSDIDLMLSLTVLHSSSISCAGKFLAQNAISEQEKRLENS